MDKRIDGTIESIPIGPPALQMEDIPITPPSWLDVAKNTPPLAGLGLIEGGGGLMRAMGDMLNSDSLANVGAEIARNAKGAAEDITPAGMSLPQQVVSGGVNSAMQMLPAVLAGPEVIVPAGIGLAAAQQGGSRYSELRDAGFSGGRSGFHASLDAMAEALGEAVALPVLAQTTRPFLNKLVHFAAKDLVGEEFTTVMQQGNAMLSDKPDMTWGEFLNGMMMTALQTPVAAGLQVGAAHGVTRLRAKIAGQQTEVPPAPPVPPGQTPGAVIGQEGPPEPPLGPPTPVPGAGLEGPPEQPPQLTPAPNPQQLPPAKDPAPPVTPPEKPGPTPEAGQPELLGWNRIDTPEGVRYQHASGAAIQEAPGGFKLMWESPGGPLEIDAYNTLEDAQRAAAGLKLDTDLPEGWQRSPLAPDRLIHMRSGFIAHLNNDGEGTSIPGQWSLYNNANTRVGIYPAGAFDKMQEAIDSHKEPKPAQQGRTLGPANMLTDTPDMMRQNNTFDPRIYNGAYASDGSTTVDVTQHPDGTYEALKQRGPLDQILAHLKQAIGVDLTQGSGLDSSYATAMMNHIYHNPEDISKVSQEVADHFGGNLQQISDYSKTRQAALGFLPPLDSSESIARHNAALFDKSSILARNAKGESVDLRNSAPGVYLDEAIKDSLVAKRLAVLADHLRQRFIPDVKFLIRERSDGSFDLRRGSMVTGGMMYKGGNVYELRISDLLKNVTHAKTQNHMYTLAHEIGHAIVAQHLATAPADIRAKITAAYLGYTRNVTRETSLLDYLVEHHGSPRNMEGRKNKTGAPSSRTYNEYVMGEAEYLADQAAMYFLKGENSAFRTMGPGVVAWLNQMIDKLKQLWETVGKRFRQNKSFADFLDELGSGNKPVVSSWRLPNTTKDPTAPPKPVPPTPVHKDPEMAKDQLLALLERRRKLMYALIRGKVPTEELDNVKNTKDVREFNWDYAYKLAARYGIPESWYGGRHIPGTWNETTGFRQNLMRGIDTTADPELRSGAAKTNDAISKFNWLLQRTMTAVQLRKKFGSSVPGVKDFVDNLEKMWSYRSRWKSQADDRVKQMKRTSRGQREAVFNLLLEEDKTGKYASDISSTVAGKRQFNLRMEEAKKAGLNEQGVALYKSIREDFDGALDEMEHQALMELYRTYPNGGPALVKAEAELRDGFDQMRKSPYVPHTRFGDHTVSVRDSSGTMQEFYQLENEHSAKSLEAKLRKEAGKGMAVSRGRMTDVMKSLVGMPPQMIAAMKAQLNLSPAQIAQFEDILKDMSHGASFVRRFKRRKDIAGWVSDAENFPRAYADYMSRFANHVSRLKYNHQLTGATLSVKDQAKMAAKLGVNTVQLDQLTNWLTRLQDYVNNPGQEFANQRAAATLWFLGFNAKSALVNSTSVPMVTLPYLSSRFGWNRSLLATTQAYKDISRQFLRKDALTPDERKMLQVLREQNKIDASFASELAGLREGGRLSDQTALTKPAAAAFAVKYWGMWLFQKMEVINREVTALAAYRLNREGKNFDPTDSEGYDHAAMEKAGQAIQDTQNENAQWNRPELMRGKKSVLTMFMGYQQNLIYQMLGGDQSWMRMLAVQMMAAGLLGMPFAKDADELIKWFARKVFGSDISAERAARAYLKDVMGNPDWLLKGVSHNVFNLDLSGSLSQGRVIPGIDALAAEGSFSDRIANAAGDVGGAGFSIILNFMKALASDDPDTLRRFQRTLPEFARAMVDGGNMISGGKALDAAGRPIADVTTGDAYMRSLGFQLSNVSQERGTRFAQKDSAQFWLTRRAYVLALWQLAMERGDGDTRDAAMKALQDFNDEAPDGNLKLTRQQIRESLNQKARGNELAAQDIGPTKTVQGTYQRIGELYGK
jgi:hypothetical protein